MRVLMLGWFGDNENSGGMEVHIREICKNIASENVPITLVVPKGANHIASGKYLRIVEIPCKRRAKTIESVIKNVSEFNKNIAKSFDRGFSFDIIHSHDWLSVAAAKKLKKKYNIPWIHTVHSLEHIRAAEETRSRISEIEKDGIADSDKIITVSNLMKKEIMKKHRIPAKKIEVIRNYLSAFSSEEFYPESAARKKIVLFAGRLALQKGVETLISAFSKVLCAHPDAKLIIAGDGSLKKSLVALAKIKGIEKAACFAGHVDEKTLESLYMQASVFVSPSVFEPFGITVLDAAYFGAPIIATKNTGALEIFGKNSVVTVAPQNKNALAEKIIALLEDGAMRASISDLAKKDVAFAENWKALSEKTAREYRKLSD